MEIFAQGEKIIDKSLEEKRQTPVGNHSQVYKKIY